MNYLTLYKRCSYLHPVGPEIMKIPVCKYISGCVLQNHSKYLQATAAGPLEYQLSLETFPHKFSLLVSHRPAGRTLKTSKPCLQIPRVSARCIHIGQSPMSMSNQHSKMSPLPPLARCPRPPPSLPPSPHPLSNSPNTLPNRHLNPSKPTPKNVFNLMDHLRKVPSLVQRHRSLQTSSQNRRNAARRLSRPKT